MFAAMFNHTRIVDLLLSRGADPQARDHAGVSALDAARMMNAHDTAARLEQLLSAEPSNPPPS